MLGVGRGSSVKALAFAFYSLAAYAIIASFLLVHLMGYGFFFFTPGGSALSMQSFDVPILMLFGLGAPLPLRVGTVFLGMWVAYGVCFVFAWRWRRSFQTVFEGDVSGKRSVFNNFLFAMPLLAGMALTAALAIILFQSVGGIETGMPYLPPDVHEAFLSSASAPLIEEFVFRLMPVGLLVVFFVFFAGRNVKALSSFGGRFKLFFLAFVYPEGAKAMAGLPTVGEHGLLRGISVPEWVAIIGTSAFFGLAHVISPTGWGIGKITSASVQGFFFAVTYVAYGFEAPILLHWYFNCYNYFFNVEIAESFFPAAIDLLSVIELLTLALGVVGWGFFAIEGVRRLLRRQKRKHPQPLLPSVTFPT